MFRMSLNNVVFRFTAVDNGSEVEKYECPECMSNFSTKRALGKFQYSAIIVNIDLTVLYGMEG